VGPIYLRFETHNLEGQVPVFISITNGLAQLHPQAMGSFFVAPYDSQVYGGGIRTRLHTGLHQTACLLVYLCTRIYERTRFRIFSVVVYDTHVCA
jgi:hypothetical protein